MSRLKQLCAGDQLLDERVEPGPRELQACTRLEDWPVLARGVGQQVVECRNSAPGVVARVGKVAGKGRSLRPELPAGSLPVFCAGLCGAGLGVRCSVGSQRRLPAWQPKHEVVIVCL